MWNSWSSRDQVDGAPCGLQRLVSEFKTDKERCERFQSAQEFHENNAHIYGKVSVCRGELAMAQVL